MSEYDRDFWEQRWSQALRAHGERVAQRPPNAHLTAEIGELRPGRAIPKVVFSHTLESVEGNARLAEASLPEEAGAALDATDKDVAIGGAGLAAQAIELGLVDELRMFRYPVVVGGGTPFLPPVTEGFSLDLVETRTFGSRVIYERYARARDESD